MEREEFEIERPDFENVPYDFRNDVEAGKFRGVGERGKVGSDGNSVGKFPMPQDSYMKGVPRAYDD